MPTAQVPETLDSRPGTYALVLECRDEKRIRIGRIGTLNMRPGFYIYVGSALGPGGLAGRVLRHARRSKRRRWHVDYLTAATSLVEVWLARGPQRLECQWARAAGRLPGAEVPLKGFGSSDCRCRSHLFFFAARPSWERFARNLKEAVPGPAP
ncbi:MAG: GIY-YIG nuclease family protein, partial [Planctomycetota bacterium]